MPEDPIKQYLREIGRKGGLKGGKARMASMTALERKALAKKASDAATKQRKATARKRKAAR